MDNGILISIIVPIYNVEHYLRACIESVLSQTYSNIEVILVNDGSTDNSYKIVEEYRVKDSRIIVINKKNGGLSDARNAGIEHAKGDYIVFVDSDDTVTNDCIEYLFRLIKNNNAQMSIGTYNIVKNNIFRPFNNNQKETVMDKKEAIRRLLVEEGYTVSACCKMYNSSLFNNVRFPVGRLYEDNNTTYKLILNSYRIAYGPKCIYNYYQRDGSITKQGFNNRKMDYIYTVDEMCEDLNDHIPELYDEIMIKRLKPRFVVLKYMAFAQLTDEQKIEKKNIIGFIKEKRSFILNNKHVDLKMKLAFIVLDVFGQNVFGKMWALYDRLK